MSEKQSEKSHEEVTKQKDKISRKLLEIVDRENLGLGYIDSSTTIQNKTLMTPSKDGGVVRLRQQTPNSPNVELVSTWRLPSGDIAEYTDYNVPEFEVKDSKGRTTHFLTNIGREDIPVAKHISADAQALASARDAVTKARASRKASQNSKRDEALDLLP